MMVSIQWIIPKWPYFGLANYYKKPRNMDVIVNMAWHVFSSEASAFCRAYDCKPSWDEWNLSSLVWSVYGYIRGNAKPGLSYPSRMMKYHQWVANIMAQLLAFCDFCRGLLSVYERFTRFTRFTTGILDILDMNFSPVCTCSCSISIRPRAGRSCQLVPSGP